MLPKIVDVHSHYMPPQVAENTTFFKVGWSDVSRQLSVMDQHGIKTSLLLYPTSDAHLKMGGWKNLCSVYNQEIAKVVKSYRGRFVGAGILPIDSPGDFPQELKRLADLELKVVSLASSYEGKFLDDDMFIPVFEFAQNNNFVVHIHPQIMNPIGEERVKDPLLTPVLEYVFDVAVCIGKMMMSGTFLKFPEVKFIFAHYGGVVPFVKERFDNTYQMLRKRDFVKDLTKLPSEYFQNLYFDMSGSKSPAALLSTLETTDITHVLFGSDFPANQNLLGTIETVERASFSADYKDFLLFKNAEKLLAL